MQRLVIAEKPSVGKAIADVLGAKTRKDNCFEGNGYIVSWCVGHLLGLAEPQDYDEKYAKWRYENLPIIPSAWKHKAKSSTQKQLKNLCDLMKRPDVDCIINASDAGREGELIYRLAYEHAQCSKPQKRLWINSMEDTAIEQGFRSLKNGADYDNLYQSALCRQKADWLVGLNLSRLFSILYNARLRVGRVQTPTLSMIVEREAKIAAFEKEPFYIVEITNGQFIAEREKTNEKAEAENVCSKIEGKTATVTAVQKSEKSISAPKLHDLTTLQREANRLFGYTAAQTLNCVQNLYEQQIVTYPRTDSRYLTADMAAGLPALVADVSEKLKFSNDNLNINPAQVVNNAKVSDHSAIIPTSSLNKADITSLPTADRNILTMICFRLISSVSDKHVYAEKVISLECEGETFTTKGKAVIHEGWRAIEQAFANSVGKTKKDTEKPLPEISEGYSFTAKADIREGFSQPPKHFTEDTLLSAMECAGDFSDIPDVERRGLGTPATRAGIIEALVKSGFLERKGKLLMPTSIGTNLMKILPESVKSPSLTAQWEHDLKRVELGEMTAQSFMTSIEKFVKDLVATHHTANTEAMSLFPSKYQQGELIGKCPRCDSSVSESAKGFFCVNKSCKFGLFKDNKFFTSKKKTLTKEIATELLTNGRIFMRSLFSKKTGKHYSATIVLDDKGEGYTSFKLEFENKDEA